MGLPRIQPLLREGSPPLPPSPDPLPQPRAPLRDPRRRSTRSGAGSHAPCKLPYPPPRPSPPLPPHPRTTAWSAGAGATSRRHPRAVQLARSARPPTGRRVARARRCGAPGCWCLSGSGGGGQVWYAPWPSRHDAVVPRHLCPPGLDRLLPPLPSPPPFPSPPRTPFAAAPPRFGTSPPPPQSPFSLQALYRQTREAGLGQGNCVWGCAPLKICAAGCWWDLSPMATPHGRPLSTWWVVEQVDESGGGICHWRPSTQPARLATSGRDRAVQAAVDPLLRLLVIARRQVNSHVLHVRYVVGPTPGKNSRLLGRHREVDATVDIRSLCGNGSPRDFFVIRSRCVAHFPRPTRI